MLACLARSPVARGALFRLLVACALPWLLGGAAGTNGGELGSVEFFGHSSTLEGRLGLQTTLSWHGLPLRRATERLAETQNLSIWLDRRVDPTQKLDLELSQTTLREVCDQIAAELAIAWVPYENLVYFGPPERVAELRTLRALARQELAGLAEEKRGAWLQPCGLSIHRLAEPRQVVSQVIHPVGVRITGLERIPHDLWPAGELPAMAPADQLTLLLSGFNLTWKLDDEGQTVIITPIVRPVLISRQVPPEAKTERLNDILAGDASAKILAEEGTTYLLARVEQHERLVTLPRARESARRKPPANAAMQVYSLTIRDQPVEGLLRQLAAKLEMSLDISPEVDRDQLGQRISISVSEVSAEQLFATIATAAALEIVLADGTVRVRLASRD